MEWAAREAVLRGVPLRIVSAASLPRWSCSRSSPSATPSSASSATTVIVPWQPRRPGPPRSAPGLLIDTDPVEGTPALAVTGSGPGALMLVTGSRGIGAFTAMVLGSVAQYVADHACCPVVVVRG